jgi:cytochrome c oxidase subunit 2
MKRPGEEDMRRTTHRISRAALFSALAFVAAACAKVAPQSVLEPEGPIARKEDRLFDITFWIAVVIFVLVEGVLVLALIKFRARRGHEEPPVQVHGNKRLEIAWTIVPALLMFGVAVPTLITIFDVAREPKNPLPVTVTARQWWWEYRYDSIKVPGTDRNLVTANELHVPVGQPVRLSLESIDVIHSYWVPRLAGKQDVIPGRKNRLTIIAEKPGTYLGQCAEFCALSHANMRLRVMAQTPGDFARWVEEQGRPATATPTGLAGQLWQNVCIACHSVTPGMQTFGPNLAHFASRTTFGGAIYTGFGSGDIRQARADLFRWLTNPQEAKPGNKMEIPKLTRDQIEALIAFLESLR